jgi:hypothetical protein
MAKHLRPTGNPVMTMAQFNTAVAAGMWQPASGLAELSQFARDEHLVDELGTEDVRRDEELIAALHAAELRVEEPFPPLPSVEQLTAVRAALQSTPERLSAAQLTAVIVGGAR